MASALEKALAKNKLESPKSPKSKKTDMVTAEVTPEIQKNVDMFLDLEQEIKEASTKQAVVSASIKKFAYEYAISNRETENLIIAGTKGELNLNFKDQYSALSPENKPEVEKYLKSKGLKPEEHLIEESKLSFNFNKLTEKEQDKLMKFLTKELGGDRFAEVVETKVSYKISNLKNLMIEKCKDIEDFQEFRSLPSHHDVTIAKRVTK